MRREALGFSANDAWLSAFKMLEDSPCCESQESRSGATKEILRGSICIDDPRQRWVVARRPALNLPFALAETIWILQGRSDSAFLNYFNGQLPKFAGHEESYHGAYGFRLRSHFGFDQLERAYQALRNNHDGRQVVLQIWDSKIDLPSEMGSPASDDVPCNIVAFLKIRNKRLEWTQVMRSNDLFRGLPYNIVQFTTLQEVMAGWLGVELGQYFHFADSLHYYLDDKSSFALENSFPAERNEDSLSLGRDESLRAFESLERVSLEIIKATTSVDDLVSLAGETTLPPSFKNVLIILIAEGIRRRGKIEAAAELVDSSCTNPIFRQMFCEWVERFSRPVGREKYGNSEK